MAPRYSQKTSFNMASVCHFEFAKFRFLSTVHTRNGNLHLHTRLDWNWLIHGWDREIKLFSKWRPSAILNFRKLQFWYVTYQHVILHFRSNFRINRPIWRWYIAKNDFQYGVRPPSWMCYDVVILHQKTAFYVPNFVLNFHDVLLRIFWNIFYFMFQLEIAYFGLNFDDFWWKIGKDVKIKYYNPQKAHPWHKARLLSVERWRFIRRCDL